MFPWFSEPYFTIGTIRHSSHFLYFFCPSFGVSQFFKDPFFLMEDSSLKPRSGYKMHSLCWRMWYSARIPAAVKVLHSDAPGLSNPFRDHLNWRKISCPRSLLLVEIPPQGMTDYSKFGLLASNQEYSELWSQFQSFLWGQLKASLNLHTRLTSFFVQFCFFPLPSTSVIPPKHSLLNFLSQSLLSKEYNSRRCGASLCSYPPNRQS